jgi:DNA-binding response OmpR family regulator
MQNNFSNLTILYVEDDAIIRDNAVSYLENYFETVFEAQDGEEAFEIYEEEKPNIIITDIKMPKLNGLELAKRIRKKDKTTPIIIATAFTDTSYLMQAVELQLIKYITKPINSKKLKIAINLVLEHLNLNNIIRLDDTSSYDKLNKTLFIDNTLIDLRHRELKLFDLLAQNHHRVVHYEEIESIVWDEEVMSKDALRALVRTLRIKLQGDYIDNISGFGYRLKVN